MYQIVSHPESAKLRKADPPLAEAGRLQLAVSSRQKTLGREQQAAGRKREVLGVKRKRKGLRNED